MKLYLVITAFAAMASTAPVAADRTGLRRRHLVNDVETAFEEDVMSPHYQRRLHCDTSGEQSCVKSCRNKNKCQDGSDACTKSCRARCCEKSGEGIVKPPDQERKCDREKERDCFRLCKAGEGPEGTQNCASNKLSGAEQEKCVDKCRDSCCEWESDNRVPSPLTASPTIKENRSEPAVVVTPGPTPRPTPFPTLSPTRAPVTPPTVPQSKDEETFPPTPNPTKAVCQTQMNADILCTVKGATDENGQPVNCNDDDIVSKVGSCDVTFEYCYTVSHDGEDCVTVTQFEKAQDGSREDLTQEFCQSKTNGDCKMCAKRANPVQICEEVQTNVCECVESKTTMFIEALEENNAICTNDDKLDIKKCSDCDIDVAITCQAFNPLTREFANDCAEQAQSQFVIAGTEECEERIKLCYTVTNVGSTCASWEDLDTNLSRTIVNGGMVKTDDVKASNDRICPGERVSICEEQEVNSCSCMKVEVEVQGENPRNKKCDTNAEYNFCKLAESKEDGGDESRKDSPGSGGSQSASGPSGGSSPKSPSGGSSPASASGGSSPKSPSGGSSPASASGGSSPKSPSGGSSPASASGGSSPASNSKASGGSKGSKQSGGSGSKASGGSKAQSGGSKGKGSSSGGSKSDGSKAGSASGGSKGGKGKGGGSGGSKGGKGKGGGSGSGGSKGGKGKGGGSKAASASGGSGGKGKGGGSKASGGSKGSGGSKNSGSKGGTAGSASGGSKGGKGSSGGSKR